MPCCSKAVVPGRPNVKCKGQVVVLKSCQVKGEVYIQMSDSNPNSHKEIQNRL